MSLSTALSIAQTALLNTSRQTTVVSRNISDASNPDYSRRMAVLTSQAPGARIVDIQRAANEQLLRNSLGALSSYEGQNTLLEGLNLLATRVNGDDNATSPATLIGRLQEALHLYSSTPSNRTLAENSVEAARQVALALNQGSDAIQASRVEADLAIAAEVADLNTLLGEFHAANKAVTQGTLAGRDVNDALDQRDALLKKISEKIPVTTLTREGNDMVILTKDGAMLYEKTPRTVSFTPLAGYTPTATGNAIYVDGVPVSGGMGANTSASGRIAALVQLRDGVAPAMQRQLDEIARGLVTAFAETDPLGVQPNAAGLFTWQGAPAIPAAATLVDGLAATISINAAFDSSAGGNPILLRDGGANGAAYVHNTTGAASFPDLLLSYDSRLDAPMAFDPSVGLGDSATLGGYSANAIGWLESMRQESSRAAETKSALMVRTAEALSNATGVNIDLEMSLLLDLEHSYEASARLLKAIDDMLTSLLAMVR
ncbi:MAG: flagellar hook-associated protein FlgK [Rhizobiaceae bacterium]